jgi:hypothetical protein
MANAKPYLNAKRVEIGGAELRFDISHNAANTDEEVTLVIIDGNAVTVADLQCSHCHHRRIQ